MTVYALLVGIDRYASPLAPDLAGCGNDVVDVLAMLGPDSVDALTLRDEQATRDAVVAGLRSHLGQAGPGDTALFWFSGHGSQALAPQEAWVVEGTKWLQTLVCHDSRVGGVPDLWDKELSALLDVVAARAGHVAVVLDSCHSEGGTRQVGSRWRAVAPGPTREPGTFLPELVAGESAPEHVALSACRRDQKAEERLLEGTPHGLFTWALLRSLARLGTAATYRALLAAVRSEVAQQRAYDQVPQLHPATSDLTDLRFLRGAAGATGTGVVMSYGLDGWQINSGRAHGLPSPPAGLRFGVPRTGREVEVDRVYPERSLVRPVNGWQPGRDQQFPMVLTALPRPSITVAAADATGAAMLSDLRSAHLRPAEPGEPVTLTVGAGPRGVRITDRQGHGADVDGDPDRVRAALEHIARWLRLRELTNPATALGEPIHLEIVPATDGQTVADLTTEPLSPGEDGAYQLAYTSAGAAPEVFIRLANTSDRPLYVVLLDLTSRYAAHATLFPPAPIGSGRTVAALSGRRIRASLPRDEPGRTVTDWLLLVACERPFDADPYLLPPLTDGATRELGEAGPPAHDDWTTQRFELRITTARPHQPATAARPDPAP